MREAQSQDASNILNKKTVGLVTEQNNSQVTSNTDAEKTRLLRF